MYVELGLFLNKNYVESLVEQFTIFCLIQNMKHLTLNYTYTVNGFRVYN